MESASNFKLTKICQQASSDKKIVDGLLARLKKLQLNDLEEFLLTRLIAPNPENIAGAFDQYEQMVQHLRGIPESSIPWIFPEDLENLTLTKELMEDEKFIGRVLRSLYVWHAGDYAPVAIELLRKFERLTEGNFLFVTLEAAIRERYIRITTMLFVRYFADLSKKWQIFFLSSDYVFISISMRLDLDDAIRRASDNFLGVENREELSRDFATCMYASTSVLGPDGATIAGLVDQFEAFRGENYDSKIIETYANDTNRWKDYTDDEKLIAKTVITLFENLISNYYVLPEMSGAERGKLLQQRPQENQAKNKQAAKAIRAEKKSLPQKPSPSSIKEMVDNRFAKNEDGQFIDVEQVFNFLEKLAQEHRDPAMAQMFYFDEKSGQFKWNV